MLYMQSSHLTLVVSSSAVMACRRPQPLKYRELPKASGSSCPQPCEGSPPRTSCQCCGFNGASKDSDMWLSSEAATGWHVSPEMVNTHAVFYRIFSKRFNNTKNALQIQFELNGFTLKLKIIFDILWYVNCIAFKISSCNRFFETRI